MPPANHQQDIKQAGREDGNRRNQPESKEGGHGGMAPITRHAQLAHDLAVLRLLGKTEAVDDRLKEALGFHTQGYPALLFQPGAFALADTLAFALHPSHTV